MKKILFLCSGNICRSPMAEFLAKKWIADNNQKNNFYITSAGLHNYHEGENMHHGTQKKLKSKNVLFNNFSSKPINQKLFDEMDLIFVMDNSNYHEISQRYGKHPKVRKITDFSTLNYQEVPDPWYTDDFEETYKILSEAIDNLMNSLI